jgi:hypothetical protein
VRKASSPRRNLYPSKSSPRFRLYRVTTAGASVPLGATLASGTVDFEALLRERGPNCVPTPLRASDRSFLPWASVPFEVRLPPRPPGLTRATRHPREGAERPALTQGRIPALEPRTSLPAFGRSRRGESVRRGRCRVRRRNDHLGVLDVERSLRGASPRSCIALVPVR